MRTATGQFQKGRSGNPSGRPAGVASKLRVLRELTTDESLARIWNALLERAAEGDVQACRVVLDRVLGPTASLADVDDGDGTDLLQALIAKVRADGHTDD
jgi:hypothetical protein